MSANEQMRVFVASRAERKKGNKLLANLILFREAYAFFRFQRRQITMASSPPLSSECKHQGPQLFLDAADTRQYLASHLFLIVCTLQFWQWMALQVSELDAISLFQP
jgi:hypothetical protein